MIDTIYIEENIRDHPRTQEVCRKFPDARQISCQRYGEVFNPKAQNFRLQKLRPALIIAEKFAGLVLQTPRGYGIGSQHNYYFSHIYNCLYDCRYCFLQGMYASANYLFFVNFADFQNEIKRICQQTTDQVHFFSGYDCDSLALEPITGFVENFVPFFAKIDNAVLELRSKSTQIRQLLAMDAIPNCVVAFSLSPDIIARKTEHKAPSLASRINALVQLQKHGWQVGLRFDPLIYQDNFHIYYRQLFDEVFSRLQVDGIHSVSLGVFRLPASHFKKMVKMYPQEKLFAPISTNNKISSYRDDIAQQMVQFCSEQILQYIGRDKFFPCLT